MGKGGTALAVKVRGIVDKVGGGVQEKKWMHGRCLDLIGSGDLTAPEVSRGPRVVSKGPRIGKADGF